MNDGTWPLVDVVIACHDSRRNLRRAVEAAFAGSEGLVRVTVVCHNLTIDAVRSSWQNLGDSRSVRAVEVHDGLRSPSAPFNLGISLAAAPWVAIMGSDDSLERGAIGAWLAHADRSGSDMLMARVRTGGREVLTPRVRPYHLGRLHPVRDRVFYRTAPLGLIRRQAIEELDCHFTEGLRTGEDVEFTARLVTSAHVELASKGSPAYVIMEDAPDRVTGRTYSGRELMLPVHHLLQQAWCKNLGPDVARSLAIKLWRMQVFPAARRPGIGIDGLADVREAALRLLRFSPQAARAFSRAETGMLSHLLSVAEPADYPKPRRFDWLFANRVGDNLDRESRLRLTAAAAIRARNLSFN